MRRWKRKGITAAEYASHAGMSRTGIQRAKEYGRLVLHDDGSIDRDASDIRMREMTNQSQQRDVPKERRRTGPKPPPDQRRRVVPDDAIDAVRETAPEGLRSDGKVTLLSARTALEVLKVREKRLQVQALEKALISADVAGAAFFRWSREVRDSLMSWPDRIAPVMASELDVDAGVLHAALTDHMRDQLTEISRMRFDLSEDDPGS